MKKLFLIFLSLFLFPFFINAFEFEILEERNYYIDGVDSIKVIEKYTIRNNSKINLIDKRNTHKFLITHLRSNSSNIQQSLNSVKVLVDNIETKYTIEKGNEDYEYYVKVDYPRSIDRNGSMVFEIQYDNYGMLEQIGALLDVYFYGIIGSSITSNSNQNIVIDTNVFINKELSRKVNFSLPDATRYSENENYYVYYFDTQKVIDNTIWIQIGDKQYYSFKINQDLTPSNNLPFNNEYRILMPRDINGAEINQKVFITNISPLPKSIEKDTDGNIFAYFDHPGNQAGNIIIEGYVEVLSNGNKVSENNSGLIKDYSDVSEYLKASDYWEVNAPEIQNVAKELKGEETNVFNIIKNTYNYVVDKINYSDVKKFGINERIGALATLRNGSGVCMEYSDLFITLLRAQGIPARAVFGFGYDSLIDGDKQEPHQWAQVLVPSTNMWLDIDVTWGENGDAAVGGNLNHFYTHIASNSPEEHSEVVLTGINATEGILSLPTYDINAVFEIPNDIEYLTQDEMLIKYPHEEKSPIINFISEIPNKFKDLISNIEGNEGLALIALVIGLLLIIFPIVYSRGKKTIINKEITFSQ